MRTVTVNAVLNGWVVKCGCQTLVYMNPDKLVEDLREYMLNPKLKEAAIIESAVNKRLIQDMSCMIPDMPTPPPQGTTDQNVLTTR